MSMEDFIITVYCLIDKLLKKQLENNKLRKCGFNPALSGFHFLGINYPRTQTPNNTNVTQANDRSVIQLNTAHYLTSLGADFAAESTRAY